MFPYLLLTMVSFIWGLNHVVGKALVSYLPPFVIATGRFTTAGLIFFCWILIKHRRLPPAKLWVPLLISGITGIFAFNSLIYTGLQYTSVINSALINSLTPIVTVFLASLMLKERVCLRHIGGAVLSVFGVALVVCSGSLRTLTELSFNRGDLIILPSTLVWALYTIYGKKIMQFISPMATTAYSTLAGLPFLWAACSWSEWDFSLSDLSWPLGMSLVLLGVVASVLASFWWNIGIERLGASRGIIFLNLIPVFSVICSIVFLKENLHPYQAAGGVIILAGILLSSGITEKKEKPVVSPTGTVTK